MSQISVRCGAFRVLKVSQGHSSTSNLAAESYKLSQHFHSVTLMNPVGIKVLAPCQYTYIHQASVQQVIIPYLNDLRRKHELRND